MTTANPISRRALEQRNRRALAHRGQTLHRSSPKSSAYRAHGGHYVFDEGPYLVATHCDLEIPGRELGVLGPSDA